MGAEISCQQKQGTVKSQTLLRDQQTAALLCSCAAAAEPLDRIAPRTIMDLLREVQKRKGNFGNNYSRSSIKKVKSLATQSLRWAYLPIFGYTCADCAREKGGCVYASRRTTHSRSLCLRPARASHSILTLYRSSTSRTVRSVLERLRSAPWVYIHQREQDGRRRADCVLVEGGSADHRAATSDMSRYLYKHAPDTGVTKLFAATMSADRGADTDPYRLPRVSAHFCHAPLRERRACSCYR